MGRIYYYFAASLPMLHFDGPPPFSVGKFLEESGRLLAPPDHEQIRLTLSAEGEPENPRHPFGAAWQDFERRLRNELVCDRAAALNKDPDDFFRGERGADHLIRQAVMDAIKSSDPLEAEKILDRARWQKLDEMLLGHYFDLEFLIAYAVKLSILERYRKIGSPEGGRIWGILSGSLLTGESATKETLSQDRAY